MVDQIGVNELQLTMIFFVNEFDLISTNRLIFRDVNSSYFCWRCVHVPSTYKKNEKKPELVFFDKPKKRN